MIKELEGSDGQVLDYRDVDDHQHREAHAVGRIQEVVVVEVDEPLTARAVRLAAEATVNARLAAAIGARETALAQVAEAQRAARAIFSLLRELAVDG